MHSFWGVIEVVSVWLVSQRNRFSASVVAMAPGEQLRDKRLAQGQFTYDLLGTNFKI